MIPVINVVKEENYYVVILVLVSFIFLATLPLLILCQRRLFGSANIVLKNKKKEFLFNVVLKYVYIYL